jgi:hypothetical protein
MASRGRHGSTVGARREEEFEDRIGARTRTSGAEGRSMIVVAQAVRRARLG